MTRIVLLGGSSGIGLATARRCDTADDVAAGIWSLLTNDFVTGTVLPVDRGHRLAAP